MSKHQLKELTPFEKIKISLGGTVTKEYSISETGQYVSEVRDKYGALVNIFEAGFNFENELGTKTELNYLQNGMISEKHTFTKTLESRFTTENGSIIPNETIEQGHFKGKVIEKNVEVEREFSEKFENGQLVETRIVEKGITDGTRVYSTSTITIEKEHSNNVSQMISEKIGEKQFIITETTTKYRVGLPRTPENMFYKLETTYRLDEGVTKMISVKETKLVENKDTSEKEYVTVVEDGNKNIVRIEHKDRTLHVKTLDDGRMEVSEKLVNGNTRIETYPANTNFFETGRSGLMVDIKEISSSGETLFESRNNFKFTFCENLFAKHELEIKVEQITQKVEELGRAVNNLIEEISENNSNFSEVNNNEQELSAEQSNETATETVENSEEQEIPEKNDENQKDDYDTFDDVE